MRGIIPRNLWYQVAKYILFEAAAAAASYYRFFIFYGYIFAVH